MQRIGFLPRHILDEEDLLFGVYIIIGKRGYCFCWSRQQHWPPQWWPR